MKEQESKWVTLVRKRYEGNTKIKPSYENDCNLLFLLNAPEQYEVEDQMLEYAQKNQNATMSELLDFFDTVATHGLPPCATEWLDDD